VNRESDTAPAASASLRWRDGPTTEPSGETMPPTTDRIRLLLDDGARNRVYPGAVWAFGTPDGIIDQGTVGLLDPTEPDHPMQADTVFDAASLTKILAVWTSIGSLWQDGLLDLDAPLGGFWTEVAGHPLAQATARQLLTHSAGVPLRAQLQNLYGTDPVAIRTGVLQEALHRPPGEAVEYTDRAALILGYLAEYLAGHPLDQVATTRVWSPLGMTDTRFGPLPAELRARCAPTELDQATGAHLRGTVHDFSARLLGGVCGISGVFTALDDLARFLRYLLDPTQAADKPGFGPQWTAPSTPEAWSPPGACSGTPRPERTPPTTSGSTTASPAPASGSHPSSSAGRSCSPTSSTTHATANPSP